MLPNHNKDLEETISMTTIIMTRTTVVVVVVVMMMMTIPFSGSTILTAENEASFQVLTRHKPHPQVIKSQISYMNNQR
jgi:hypothetical protein